MSGDATVIAPHVYKVVEENERVRILEFRAGAHEVTEMHSHPDHVAITTSAGRFRFTSADGSSMDVDLLPGQSLFMPAGSHRTENLGDAEATGFIIELK
jgi:beta-alanine degradation protein BauB